MTGPVLYLLAVVALGTTLLLALDHWMPPCLDRVLRAALGEEES